jgi:hypothetical protein
MRDIQELMKTQVISATANNKSSISHALQLHDEVDKLRKETKVLKVENEKLKQQNQSLIDGQRTYIDLITEWEQTLRSADEKSIQKLKKVEEQLNRLQVSWDSLYDDLSKVREERNELRAKLDGIGSSTDRPSMTMTAGTAIDANDNNNKDHSSCSVLSPPRRGTSLRSSVFQQFTRTNSLTAAGETSRTTTTDVPTGRMDQAELLRKAVKRHSSFSAVAGHGVGAGVSVGNISPRKDVNSDKKLHDLECENLNLKSTIIRLQTQCREEQYRKLHPSSCSTSSSSADNNTRSLLPSPSKYPSPIPEQNASGEDVTANPTSFHPPSRLSRRAISLMQSSGHSRRMMSQSLQPLSSATMMPAQVPKRHVEEDMKADVRHACLPPRLPSDEEQDEESSSILPVNSFQDGEDATAKKDGLDKSYSSKDRDSTAVTISSFSDNDDEDDEDDEDEKSIDDSPLESKEEEPKDGNYPRLPPPIPAVSTSVGLTTTNESIDSNKRDYENDDRRAGQGMFGALRMAKSLYPGSAGSSFATSIVSSSSTTTASSSSWGRSPARDQYLNRENQSILLSHPAYHPQKNNKNIFIDVESQSSFSTLSDNYHPSPVEPKRVRSLARWW